MTNCIELVTKKDYIKKHLRTIEDLKQQIIDETLTDEEFFDIFRTIRDLRYEIMLEENTDTRR